MDTTTLTRVSVVNPKFPLRKDMYGNDATNFCIGFAWTVDDIVYKVKTLYGVIEVLKDEITFFNQKYVLTNKKVLSWETI